MAGKAMSHRLALLLLGPLLYLQGRSARRMALKLPEATGPRQGQQGQGRAVRLLITGDSAAAGVGVHTQSQALAGRLVALLSRQHAVDWQLLAQSGLSSGQLLDSLRSVRKQRFDVVIVSIGVNDVTGLTRSRTWLQNLQNIVAILREELGAQQVLLSRLPPMHRFTALPQPLRWWLGLRARHLDGLLRELASTTPHCRYLEIPYPADPSYIATDGFHPGARAYQLWAEHAVATLQAPEPD